MEQGEKRHQATPHRREEARRKGQTPVSKDLASAALLVGALLALMFLGQPIVQFVSSLFELYLTSPVLSTDRDTEIAKSRELILQLAQAMMPFMAALLLTGIAVHVGQVGFMFLPEKVSFDLSRVNPLKGIGRIFTITNLARLSFGIFKLIVVTAVAIYSLWGKIDEIVTIGLNSSLQVAVYLIDLTLWTALKMGVALLILALLDYAFQRWKHEQELRMTDQEMREEMRNTQGDPQVVGRRRAIQRQLAMNRMATALPTADAVVTNPTELAVAIKYDFGEMEAPIVVAKGAGVLAQRIRRMALEQNIPIVERKELARALYRDVEVNQQVPADQYAAVAEVLKYVYELKGVELPEAAQQAAA